MGELWRGWRYFILSDHNNHNHACREQQGYRFHVAIFENSHGLRVGERKNNSRLWEGKWAELSTQMTFGGLLVYVGDGFHSHESGACRGGLVTARRCGLAN